MTWRSERPPGSGRPPQGGVGSTRGWPVAGEPWPRTPGSAAPLRAGGSAPVSGGDGAGLGERDAVLERVRRQREREGKTSWKRIEGRAERERKGEGCPGSGRGCGLSPQSRCSVGASGDGQRLGVGMGKEEGRAESSEADQTPLLRVPETVCTHQGGSVPCPRPPTPLTPRWGTLPGPGAAHACPSPAAAPGWGSASL